MGPAAKVDMNALSLQWFDHWLRDRDNGIMDRLPPVRYFVMGDREWRSAEPGRRPGRKRSCSTPPDGTCPSIRHPSKTGTRCVDRYDDPARTLGGDAVLTVRDEHWDPGDDPGAAASAARQRQRGPQDQSSQEHKGLTFNRAARKPLTIAGPIRASVSVEVTGSTDRSMRRSWCDSPRSILTVGRSTSSMGRAD
jgi:predicted acyl esterase